MTASHDCAEGKESAHVHLQARPPTGADDDRKKRRTLELPARSCPVLVYIVRESNPCRVDGNDA